MLHVHDVALINSHAEGKESAEASAFIETKENATPRRERSLLFRAMQGTLSDFKQVLRVLGAQLPIPTLI